MMDEATALLMECKEQCDGVERMSPADLARGLQRVLAPFVGANDDDLDEQARKTLEARRPALWGIIQQDVAAVTAALAHPSMIAHASQRRPGGGRKPQGEYANRKASFTMRMSVDLRAGLERSARKTGRALSQEVEHLLRGALGLTAGGPGVRRREQRISRRLAQLEARLQQLERSK